MHFCRVLWYSRIILTQLKYCLSATAPVLSLFGFTLPVLLVLLAICFLDMVRGGGEGATESTL